MSALPPKADITSLPRYARARLALPPACDIGAPIPEVGNVSVPTFRQCAREKDSINRPAIRQPDRTAVQMGRLTRLHAPPYFIGHAVYLACDRDTASLDFKHPGMNVTDGVEAIVGSGAKRSNEFSAIQVVMQRQAPHQRSVYE